MLSSVQVNLIAVLAVPTIVSLKLATPTKWDVPPVTLSPLRAVTIPTESTFVTSSYVNTPPTDKLPPTDKFFSTPNPPSNITDPVSF